MNQKKTLSRTIGRAPLSASCGGVAAIAIALSLLSGRLIASPISGPVLSPINGHSYYLLETASWTASEAEAVALGGHLATVNSAEENEWIASTFSMYGDVYRALWIGLNDAAEEGTFVWSSGAPVVYLNWGPGEPNNAGDEDYVNILPPFDWRYPGWNDYPNIAGLNGVVEVSASHVPEIDPSSVGSVLAFLTGALSLLERLARHGRPVARAA